MRVPSRSLRILALALAAGLASGADALAQRGGMGGGMGGRGGSVSRPSGGGGVSRGASVSRGSSRGSASVSRPSSSGSPGSAPSSSSSRGASSYGSRPGSVAPSTTSAPRVTRSTSPSVRYVTPRETAGSSSSGTSTVVESTVRPSPSVEVANLAERYTPERTSRVVEPRTIEVAPGVLDFESVGAPPARRPFPRPYGSADRGGPAAGRSGVDIRRGSTGRGSTGRGSVSAERAISPSDILQRYRGSAEERVAEQDAPARRPVHAADLPKLARERLAASERPTRRSPSEVSDLRTRSERVESLRRQRAIREADGARPAIASAGSLERARAVDEHHNGGHHDDGHGCHDWEHETDWHFSYYAGFYFGCGWGWGWYWYYPCWWWYRYYCWPYYTGYPVYLTQTVYVSDGGYYTTVPAEEEVVYVEAPPDEETLVGEGVAAGKSSSPALSAQLARAADYYLELGDRAFREGRYGDAVHFYAKAVEYAPERGILYLILADALFATGDYHYAAYALRRAFELEPVLVSTGIDKHAFYSDPREFDRQLAVLELYLEDHFLDEDARLVLAANYYYGGRPQAAVELLESAFSLDVAQSPEGALLLDAARGSLDPRRTTPAPAQAEGD